MDAFRKCWLCVALLSLAISASETVVISPNQNQCGGHRRNKNGTISSPGYPKVYPAESNCEWSIIADSGSGITITFYEFRLDSGDILKIYDNDPSAEASKPKWPAFTGIIPARTVYTVHYNRVWIVFMSDRETTSQKGRFHIGYEVSNTQCSDVDAPKNGSRKFGDSNHGYTVTFSCDAGYVLRGNSTLTCVLQGSKGLRWSGKLPVCVAPCYSDSSFNKVGDNFFTVPKNKPVILSPKYPSPLGNPGKCIWKISVGAGLYVNLTTTDFNLDKFTRLEIWDRSIGANLLGNYTGKSFPKHVTSNSNTVYITLYSNGPSVGRFTLRYSLSNSTDCAPPRIPENMYIAPSKSTYHKDDAVMYKCLSGFVLAPKNSHNTRTKCSVGKRWTVASLPKCVAHCKEWDPDNLTYRDVILRNGSGVIYSYGYPRPITKGSCQYRIVVNKGYMIEFDLTKVTVDTFTKLKIYSGVSVKNATLGMTVTAANMQNVKTFKLQSSNAIVVIEKTGGESGNSFSLSYSSTTSGECIKPVLQNGYVSSQTNGYSISSVLRLGCAPFFAIRGASEVMCVAGKTKSHWEPALPSCVSQCGGSYPLLSNGTIISPRVSKNQRCFWHIYAANPAHKKIRYSVSVKLDLLHLTSNDILVIQPISGEVKVLKNRHKVGGDPLVFTVSPAGFTVSFNPSENSTEGGRFRLTYQSQIYTPRTCKMPLASSHLWIYSGNARAGSTAMFRCKQPYDLVGAEWSTCSAEGGDEPVWKPALPTCTLDCGTEEGSQFEFVRNATFDGAIANPGFPNMIRGRQNCRWVIQALPGYRVKASFSYLDFPKQHKDITVKIFDGAVIGHQKPLLVETEYGVLPPNVTSLSGALTVDYTCTLGDLTANKGFYLQYSMVEYTPLVPRTTEASTSTTTTVVTRPTIGEGSKPPVVVRTLPYRPTELQTTPVQLNEKYDKHLRKVETPLKKGTNPGIIVAVVIVCILLVVGGTIGGFYLYRRKHPARILLGQRFPKFHNPLYEHQQSTSSTFSLDKDFNVSSSSSASLT